MITVPDAPSALGLPEKFGEWRVYQREVVEKLLNSDKRYFICEMPTGAGKSLVALAASAAMDAKTYYVVHTKQLQDQILGDYPDVKSVKGRSNFPCLVKKDMTAANCVYAMLKRTCPVKDKCPYRIQKAAAQSARVSVHNYAYYLAAFNYVGDWDYADLLVFDECHLVDNQLLRFVELVLTYDDVHGKAGIPFPGSERPERIMECVTKCETRLADKIASLKSRYCFDLDLEEYNNIPEEVLKEISSLESLLRKIRFLLSIYDDSWIVDYTRGSERDWSRARITFRPVWVNQFSDYVFKFGEKILMMSATIGSIDLFCESLGLDVNEVDYMTLPSNFPREIRPFVYSPVGRMSNKFYEENIEPLVRFIDRIIKSHYDEKGVVHTVNYKILKDILNSSAYFDNFIYHESAEGRDAALEEFKESKAPSILVSPSMHCYDDETEVLTRRGWILFSELTYADDIATLNPETDLFEWQKPTDIVKYFYHGDMISIGARSLDLVVTPGHSVLAKKRSWDKFKFLRADSLVGEYQFRKDCVWEGEDVEYFTIPEVRYVRNITNQYVSIDNFEQIYPPIKVKMDDWVRFFGWWLSEGSTAKQSKHSGSITMTQNLDSPFVAEIVDCWDSIFGTGYGCREDDGRRYCWYANNVQVYSYLRQFGDSHTKYIPEEFKNLSTRQLRILYDALMKGDGDGLRIGTVSRVLADDIQEIAIKLGIAGSLTTKDLSDDSGSLCKSNYYVIHALTGSRNQLNPRTSNISRIGYSGYVFCAEVPNHTMLVRRNGKYVWCGNTGVDLPDDDARWQILCKLPFAYLGDKQIAKRLEQNPEWYRQDCANRIVQTAGRIVRSKNDLGITYCPDENFRWFVHKNGHLFPRWFLDGIAKEVS